jgi:hypothetical protein
MGRMAGACGGNDPDDGNGEGTEDPGGNRTLLRMFSGLLAPIMMGFGSCIIFTCDLFRRRNLTQHGAIS